ncbi:MAG: glycoside hydrolase family 5 protein [Verrucomicrobiae bacterium]|nr:glycoside hydrolase family 5 protein [Verrucomicrobiae bacterium]
MRLLWIGMVVLALPWSALPAAPVRGEVVYTNDFETPASLQGWQGRWESDAGYQGGRAALFQQAPGLTNQSVTARLALPLEKVRGTVLRVSAQVKAEGVTPKPNPWNGIKLMLAIESPAGNQWPQASVETGTFDWRRVSMTARIPANATQVWLVLGMERVAGKVWLDDVGVSVAKTLPAQLPPPFPGPMYRGHDLPRLRGAMIHPNINEEGLRTLGQAWNANLIRWQLIRSGRSGQVNEVQDFDAWAEGELKKLDAALPLCRKYGLYVVLDLHSPPGGRATAGGYIGSDHRLFTERAAQDKFVEFWQRTARRYKGVDVIWGFDLVNEPVEDYVEEGRDDWAALAERAARAIRAEDPRRTIIVEPSPWGGPQGLADFVPLPLSNIVYSVHMYIPHRFTHQNVHGPSEPILYPGQAEGKYWDARQLEAALQPVIDFQRRYNVHIYIGEFSAIRWAPEGSAYRYLKDVIEIFEKHGWDWSYHAFREWQGWSVEHDENRANTRPAAQPTERQKLLMEWFAKNRKPAWAGK